MAMRSKSQALTIDEVRARFEAWRQNRQGKSPIPDELWTAAGVQDFIARNDYDRGEVRRQTTLSDFLTKDLDALNFTYAITLERGRHLYFPGSGFEMATTMVWVLEALGPR